MTTLKTLLHKAGESPDSLADRDWVRLKTEDRRPATYTRTCAAGTAAPARRLPDDSDLHRVEPF